MYNHLLPIRQSAAGSPAPKVSASIPVLARPRLGLGARGLRRGAHANSVVVVVVVVIVTHCIAYSSPEGSIDRARRAGSFYVLCVN